MPINLNSQNLKHFLLPHVLNLKSRKENPTMEWTHRLRSLIEHRLNHKVSRRTFLKGLFAGGARLGVASSLPPSPYISDRYTWEKFFQKHYKEMNSRDKEKVFSRIEKETKQTYKVDVKISDPPPIPGVKFIG